MASDFSVTWQCLSKTTIGFSLLIKLHAVDCLYLYVFTYMFIYVHMTYAQFLRARWSQENLRHEFLMALFTHPLAFASFAVRLQWTDGTLRK
jgi:hypothetical protein